MTDPASGCLLDDLGVLHISGADARKFLQGQLSNDMEQLRTERLLRAGLHNAQGRTLAVLALLTAADDSILAVLPRELLGTVSSLLKRYVLRSKVTLSDASEHYRIYGLTSRPDEAIADGGLLVRYGAGDDERLLLLLPAGASPLPSSIMRERWRALDIAAGLPQVCGATSGHFVAQMLNLDCIDAVSFDKGCYTGQEIIARAHYRGRVKRRMQRFVTDGAPRPDVAPQSGLPVGLQAGDTGRLHDGRHYEIVDAARLGDGRYEFLAVAHLPGATPDPATTDPDGAEAAPAAAAPTGALRLVAQPQPLPYQLP